MKLLAEKLVLTVAVLLNRIEVIPALCFHKGNPSAEPGAGGLFGRATLKGKTGKALIHEAMPDSHREVVGQFMSDSSQASREGVVPVLMVVRFNQASRPTDPHHPMALSIPNVFRGGLVYLE